MAKPDDQSLFVSDYLVGKVRYTSKKVSEAINKLSIVKEQVLKSKSSVLTSGSNNTESNQMTPYGDLLTH